MFHVTNATPARKRPQLSLEELNQLRWLLGGVLMLVAVATVAYIDAEAWLLIGLTAGVALATTVWPTLPARVPRIVHLLSFPFMAAFFALDLWLRSELLPAIVRLDMLLLLYRAIVYRQRRDDLQVIVLGLFLVVVAGVLTVSLVFAAQILAYTGCALVFLLVLTLVESSRDESELPAVTSQKPQTGSEPNTRPQPPAWAVHANWGRLLRRVAAVVDARVVALSAALFLGVIAGTSVLFLVIPRFQLDNGMFLERFITKKARSGFSDSIRFGDVTEIQQDTSVALHVDVSDPGQIPLAPYWRMLVLDAYENGTFRMSPALRIHRFAATRVGSIVWGDGRLRRSPARWTVFFEPGISRYLPLLGPFQQLRFAEAQTYQNARELALLALTKDPVTMTAYQVESFDLSARLRDSPGGYYGEESSSRALSEAERAILRRLVAEATSGAEVGTAQFASRLGAWLRERHAYSLSPRIPEGKGDPLVRWVDSRAAGHCELFAGSFVLLARAAGHRARVVTGFRGGTWNGFSTNSFTVRNSDAHAWAEIFDRESASWLRADPLELPTNIQTAGGIGGADVARRTDRSWAARLDSLRVFWYRRVVSFDEQSQVHTLKAAKELAQSGLQRLSARFNVGVRGLKAWWQQPWSLGRGVKLGTGLLVLAALPFGWRSVKVRLLRWSFWRRPDRRDDPIRREAGRWLKRLAVHPTGRNSPVVAELQRLRFGARQNWAEPGRVFRIARSDWKRCRHR